MKKNYDKTISYVVVQSFPICLHKEVECDLGIILVIYSSESLFPFFFFGSE